MKITTSGRKITITEGLESYIVKKLSRLSKFFNDSARAQATLSVQKDYHTIEVTVYHSGMIFRAEVTDEDMYRSIDKVVDVLERQIRKQKTKLEKKLRAGAFEDYSIQDEIDEEKEFKIVKTKRYDSKPMSSEEAILQMNLLGHGFYVYLNSETMEKEVVYKRKDGNYGLIALG